MNDAQRARVAANEAVFRAVNEKIEDLNTAFAAMTESFIIVCECGESTCSAQIEVPKGHYEQIRSDPTLFIIVPGHEIPEVEDVAGRHEGYDVVRKRPGTVGETVAVGTDPRS